MSPVAADRAVASTLLPTVSFIVGASVTSALDNPSE